MPADLEGRQLCPRFLEPQAKLGVHRERFRRFDAHGKERVDEGAIAGVAHRLAREHRIIHPNGTIKHTQAIGHPVLDRSGNVVEFVGSAVDITDVKRTEREREREIAPTASGACPHQQSDNDG